MKCTKCGNEYEGNFCPICGQPSNQAKQTTQQISDQHKQSQQINQQSSISTKKKHTGRNILIGIVAIILFFIIIGSCSNKKSSEANNTAQSSISSSETVFSSSVSQIQTKDSGDLGKYHVAIKSARLSKDYKNEDALIVSFDFTNNSDEANAFTWSIVDTAYQDGIQLDSAVISSSDTNNNIDEASKKIQPGVTLSVEQAFILSNTTSPVKLETKEFISFSDDKLEKTFDLSQLTQ